ncbi:MAG: metallophosphoesterase [Candidatus Woesearchaeota archaeon]
MKVLATGDFHGDVLFAKQVSQKAKESDLVFLIGDVTQDDDFFENTIGPIAKYAKKLAFLPGNHESPSTMDFLLQKYGMLNLHGDGFKVGDVGFFGCGGATCGPHFVLSEDEIFSHLKTGFEKIKDIRKKVMITHMHPAGSIMGKIDRFVSPSKAITKAIKELKPDLLICGHAHWGQGMEEILYGTKIINVGRQTKIIDI